MNDTSTANIKQILTSFHNISQIYENQQWVRTVTAEDIKQAFKLAHFIEKTVQKFDETNSRAQFFEMLKVWGGKNRVRVYEHEFYAKMCDHLLVKFFKCRALNEGVIDIAVRMYTSLFPKQRLQAVLKDLIMTSAAFEAVSQFCVANKTALNLNYLKHELILNEWLRDYESGNKEAVLTLIKESLTSFKVENCLPVLLGILALEVKNSVTDLILQSILEKMLDRSILSKTFWLTMTKTIDANCLAQVCTNYFEFLESLCNFLIYIGSMMEEKNSEWLPDPSISLCPEITYTELQLIFITLCKHSHENYVRSRLKEAENCTDSKIWNEIINKC
ncbi:uncharacterized protein Ufm1 isoform X1 [Tribolium castaneum]|uniref:uncharacterized protein Ufm1 isoform X1 n=1 Tax=Tribolium castaneum TaxID=7070 RepID=UPI00046C3119|nr:PREDICTED: uncharacterized protein LOC661416 isoform X1 [Tribolium castaneum]|eukprot:XP_008192068.1 PREDICTED: uncharacterized protein LOC661416 isoform X1 [Tribolium castaneum]